MSSRLFDVKLIMAISRKSADVKSIVTSSTRVSRSTALLAAFGRRDCVSEYHLSTRSVNNLKMVTLDFQQHSLLSCRCCVDRLLADGD